jgi:ubiquinone/menaquinone biosynthesis C-methylase UbiE
MTMDQNANQSKASIAANASYFLKNIEEYDKHVRTIDTYRRIHHFLTQAVAGADTLLDIGNGGVFPYDASGVGRITALDLFLGSLPPELLRSHFPPNAQAKEGSALSIPEPDRSFDMVLMVMLLHHLAGGDWRESWRNAQRAIGEAWRVLRPGGRLLIVESCVPYWFFVLERPAFSILTRTFKSILSHPITIQYPVAMVEGELRQKSPLVKVEEIPKGAAVLQFGFKVPSFITPVHVFALEAKKPA